MSLVFATSFGLTVLSMVPAFLSQFIIDYILARRDTQLLALLVVAAVVVGAVVGLMAWLRQYYLAFLGSRFDFRMTSAFMRKLYSLPYDFFATRHVGDFTRRLSELERVRRFLTRRFMGTVLNFMNLVVYGVALFLYSVVVAALVYLTAPLLTLLAVLFSRHLRRYYNESFAARSEQDSLLADQVRGVAARWRFEEALVRTLRNRYRFQITAGTLRALSGFVHQLISVAIIGLAAYLAIQGQMTPGQVVAVSILAAGVTRPFHSLARMWAELQEVWMVMDRLNDVFLAESEQRPGQQALIKPRLRGEIEFQDVWFRYGGESNPWALKGVSFRILPGPRMALVGPSGAGKSTVALLTGRLYEPTQGTILVDGRDYREYDRQWLRQQIGLVMHETSLFRGTILENIAYGNPSPDMERVEAAAAMANATEFIQEKPNGYDYMITHGGLGLSGGQKQRLALARILYINPAVLVLDEGTSGVDPRLERAILEALQQDFQDRTLVSILHRLPLLQFYDYFVVLQHGQVERCGTHEELVGQGGYFAEVFSRDQ